MIIIMWQIIDIFAVAALCIGFVVEFASRGSRTTDRKKWLRPMVMGTLSLLLASLIGYADRDFIIGRGIFTIVAILFMGYGVALLFHQNKG